MLLVSLAMIFLHLARSSANPSSTLTLPYLVALFLLFYFFVYSPSSPMLGVGLAMILLHLARSSANPSSISNTSISRGTVPSVSTSVSSEAASCCWLSRALTSRPAVVEGCQFTPYRGRGVQGGRVPVSDSGTGRGLSVHQQVQRRVGLSSPAPAVPETLFYTVLTKSGGVLVAHLRDTMCDLAPYDFQVGGHHKGSQSHVLKDGKGRILKPLKLNANPTFNPDVEVTRKKTHFEDELQPVCRDELEFYQRIATSTHQDDVTLHPLMPAFHGTHSVPGPDGKDELHLLLGDLTWGLRQPCVADIKIGRTDHYPGKAMKKRAMLQELGFRLTGMRVVQIDIDSQITKVDQEDCKQWTTQQVLEGLDNFCQGTTGIATHLRHSIMRELQHVHHWVESQRSYMLRGSSILVVYDADQLMSVPQDVMNGETVVPREPWPKVTVKMIDFAHVLHSFGNRDDNYLFGLENLLKYIDNKDVKL